MRRGITINLERVWIEGIKERREGFEVTLKGLTTKKTPYTVRCSKLSYDEIACVARQMTNGLVLLSDNVNESIGSIREATEL